MDQSLAITEPKNSDRVRRAFQDGALYDGEALSVSNAKKQTEVKFDDGDEEFIYLVYGTASIILKRPVKKVSLTAPTYASISALTLA